MFPKHDYVWVKFFQDESCAYHHYRSCLAWNTNDIRTFCEEETQTGDYHHMVVEVDQVPVYQGPIDADAVIDCLAVRFADSLFPMIRCDGYLLTEEFTERIRRYLEAVKVLVGDDSDMEDIIYARDVSYGEGDDIQKCLDAILSIEQI